MWRFIMVSFAFLGWSFYVLSGGADYAPHAHSLQAQARSGGGQVVARVDPVVVSQLAAGDDRANNVDLTIPTFTTLADFDRSKSGSLEVTLVSVQPEVEFEAGLNAAAQKVETLIQTPELTETDNAPEPAAASTDIRLVNGSTVNLRDGPSIFYLELASLDKDTRVEVMDDPGKGWLKVRVVETDQIGWMADWLVTAAAN